MNRSALVRLGALMLSSIVVLAPEGTRAEAIDLDGIENGSFFQPKSLEFHAGLYIVSPVSRTYKAWAPGGTPGFTSNCYGFISASIPFTVIGDCTERFATEDEALQHALPAFFSLPATEEVSFWLQDCVGCTADNSGGVSLLVQPAVLTAISPAHLWIGLRNSDDQGTQFDLLVEVLSTMTPW